MGLQPSGSSSLSLPSQTSPADKTPHPTPFSRRGEALARRLCGVESARPSVDLEDPELAGRLMSLVVGAGDDAGPGAATAVGPALAARIMQVCGWGWE